MSFCRNSLFLIRKCITANVQGSVIGTRNIKRWVSPTLKELYRRKQRTEPLVIPRNKFIEFNYEAELYAFGKRLGEEFDQNILRQALVQRTYANLEKEHAKENGVPLNSLEHNAELVKEGEDIITHYIKEEYRKSYPEEIADAVCKYLTTEEMLAHVAKHIGLTDLVLTAEYPVEKSTLSDTFKAVVAALKHSQNLKRANQFVKDILICQMNGKDVYEIWDPEKPYEYLLNLLKQRGVSDIEPRLCNKSGVNTILANYQVGLYKDKKLLGLGWGETVETAKETAALDAIQKIHSNSGQL